MMKAAIFSHYDPDGIVDDYVLYSIRCYRQYFDHIIFVSTSNLDVGQRLRAQSIADVVVCRENIGYDFGSWRIGFEILDLRQYESVAFINDSVYGPCDNIEYFMGCCERSRGDLWGASINYQFSPHVQSYFMVFKQNLLRSGFAKRFWTNVVPVESKFDLIMRYEVGLSQSVLKHGFAIDAVANLNYLNRSVRQTVLRENISKDPDNRWKVGKDIILSDPCPNPVQMFWGEVLRMGAPFVKAELFKSNPLCINQASALSYIKEIGWFDTNMIIRHLERVMSGADFLSLVNKLEQKY